MQNNLNTSNPNHYIYETKHLKIAILGGIRFNNLEAMRVTLGIQKLKSEQVLRQNMRLDIILCKLLFVLMFNSASFPKDNQKLIHYQGPLLNG